MNIKKHYDRFVYQIFFTHFFIVTIIPYMKQDYQPWLKIGCTLNLLIVGVFCGATIIWLMGNKNRFPNRFSWLWITVILTEIVCNLLTFASYCYYLIFYITNRKERIMGLPIWLVGILIFLYYIKIFLVLEMVILKFFDMCCYRQHCLYHITSLGIPVGLSIAMTTAFMTGIGDDKKYKKCIGSSVIFMFVIVLLLSIIKNLVRAFRMAEKINKHNEFSGKCFSLLYAMLTFEAIQQLFIYKFDTFNTLIVFHIREMAGWRWIAFSSYGVIMYLTDDNFNKAVHQCSGLQGYKTVINNWGSDEDTGETEV